MDHPRPSTPFPPSTRILKQLRMTIESGMNPNVRVPSPPKLKSQFSEYAPAKISSQLMPLRLFFKVSSLASIEKTKLLSKLSI